MSTTRRRAYSIRRKLGNLYPEIKTQLHYKNPFELLVATMLSAQCTDKQVNAVTRVLFESLKTPEDFVRVSLERLEHVVYPTGYYHNKARNIKNCAKALLEKFNGEVPDTRDKLVSLPGVGRKTANVVIGAAFNKPGMVVDTHVARISQRLGLTTNKDPEKIEFDLMEIIPESAWSDFSLRLVYFGRQYCTARNPKCSECPINRLCNWEGKKLKAAELKAERQKS